MNANPQMVAPGHELVVALQPVQGTLLAEQPPITYEISADGDLTLIQADSLGNDDAVILIRAAFVMSFLDRLTDALGIPSLR